MGDVLTVRVRLVGRVAYEQPVPLALHDQLPHIGDFIDVPLSDHIVHACVTATSPPICRSSDSVKYVVFATERTNGAGLPVRLVDVSSPDK